MFDSNGPDLRIRGTSQQLFEKYLQLGRDATSGGDRVMAESYFQHAEHYFRILNAMNQAAQQNQQNGQQQNGRAAPALRQRGGAQPRDEPEEPTRVPPAGRPARGPRNPDRRRTARGLCDRGGIYLPALHPFSGLGGQSAAERSVRGRPAPAPANRRIAKALAQRVDRRLGGGAPRRLGVRQIAPIRFASGSSGLAPIPISRNAVPVASRNSSALGGVEQPVGQNRRARQPPGPAADGEIRRLQFQHHAAGGKLVLLQPAGQLLRQAPEMRLQVGNVGQICVEGGFRR